MLAAHLAHQANLPLLVAELLIARGIETAQAAEVFLRPGIAQLHDPYLMKGMRRAVDRVLAAISANEKLLIYGDYDVDGTIATVLLKTAIERVAKLCGSTAQVAYHVPHRIREGYGMQNNILADAHENGITLVLSVDTGIRAFAAAKEAQRLGLDLIVTDHHLPEERGTPHAVAVLNPNQAGCEYPCKHLCGAGVAFKLAQALLESDLPAGPQEKDARESGNALKHLSGAPADAAKIIRSFLKLLAIATIADAVPLAGENRVITAVGLDELRRPVQPGLRELMRLAQLDPAKTFTATDIAFRLAPRINAAGRMDIADDVIELFLTRDHGSATRLAEKLNRLNDERRATEAAALAQIEALLPNVLAGSCIILDDHASGAPGVGGTDSAKWHRGVIGILASRVVDRTGLPAILITHEVDELGVSQAHGSGRSIPGFHLLDALTAVDSGHGTPLFSRFGGHAHAVGFSMPSALVPELRSRMQAYSSLHLEHALLAITLRCDAELPLDRINPSLATWLCRFEPLGMGNPEPVFIARRVRITAPLRKIKEKHIRLRVQLGQRGAHFNCLGWNWASRADEMRLEENMLVDIAYKLRENTHPDFGGQELELCGLSPCDTQTTANNQP